MTDVNEKENAKQRLIETLNAKADEFKALCVEAGVNAKAELDAVIAAAVALRWWAGKLCCLWSRRRLFNHRLRGNPVDHESTG